MICSPHTIWQCDQMLRDLCRKINGDLLTYLELSGEIDKLLDYRIDLMKLQAPRR